MNDINVFGEAYYIEDQGGANRNNHSKSQRFWIGYPAINQISFKKKNQRENLVLAGSLEKKIEKWVDTECKGSCP